MYATGDYSQSRLAVAFHVSQSQIGRIVRNVHWKHVPTAAECVQAFSGRKGVLKG